MSRVVTYMQKYLGQACLGQKHLGQAKLNQTIKARFGRPIKGVQSIVQSRVTRDQGDLQTAKNQERTAAICCHGNFGPAKILVWGTKIPGKFGPPDYYFQKMLVRAWNNGPSANTRCKHFNDTSSCQSVCIVSKSLKKSFGKQNKLLKLLNSCKYRLVCFN